VTKRWRRVGTALVVAITVATIPVPAGAAPTVSDREAAIAALEQQVGLLGKGEATKAYDLLVPEQQAIFTREQYAKCAYQGFYVKKIKVRAVEERRTRIPGTSITKPAIVITARVQLTGDRFTQKTREFEVDGQWRYAVREPLKFATC
jgi:hypothetical protein